MIITLRMIVPVALIIVTIPLCLSRSVCDKYRTTSRSSYSSYGVQYSYKCGWWRRCRATRYVKYSYRRYYQTCSTECCSGYRQTGRYTPSKYAIVHVLTPTTFCITAGDTSYPICTPICSQGCYNGGKCVKPGVCDCASGYRGYNCREWYCRRGCLNGGTCVGPNRCRCHSGWTRYDCRTYYCTQTCQNGGACTGPNRCTCASKWTGYDCTTPVCSQGCYNGGTCRSPGVCSCAYGWRGYRCTEYYCPSGCYNGGACTGPNRCRCHSGWTGYNCRTYYCSQTCYNGGTCTGPNRCTCASGWGGYDCRTPICSQGCYNGGTCIRPGVCNCRTGWTGYNCRTPVCSQGCYNGGTCIRPGTCNCRTGWTGYNCRTPICSQGCFNGGTCIRPGVCSCASGWIAYNCGTPHCPQGCYNGGICTSPHTCTCKTGWTSSDCRSDVNECAVSNDCSQTCVNQLGSYRCLCRNGFVLQIDGKQCDDINECLDNNTGCAHTCNNTLGSYYCTCNSGYELLTNRHNCTDIMECRDGLHNCSQRCIELDGGFTCACNEGYELQEDQVSCSDVNECELGLDKCEQNCINIKGSYNCNCQTGFLLNADNTSCSDIDECKQNNGGCSQSCNNTYGSYKCSCAAGYQLGFDGFACTANYCPPLMKPRNGNYSCDGPQTTGAMCNFQCNNGYELVGLEAQTCLSNGMWSGNTSCQILHCDMLANPEKGSVILPCGTKLSTTCRIVCSPGYYTESTNPIQQCQLMEGNVVEWTEPPDCIKRQACNPDPCKHNGVCYISGEEGFICDCDGTGYAGETCDVLLIDAPDFSALAVNSPMEFAVSAQPDRSFMLEMMPDDRGYIEVVPSRVWFSNSRTNWNISMTAKKPGLYKLQYMVNDNTLNYKPLPPATILVTDDDTNEVNYFSKHNLSYGLLKSGCCQGGETELGLNFNCPSSSNNLLLNSTCGWITKGGLHSAGVIFSSLNGFNMPIAIAGARFQTYGQYIDLQGLKGGEFEYSCIGCNGGSIGNTFKSNGNCEIEKISVANVQNFLHHESLAYTYLHNAQSLIPDWLSLEVLQSNRSHDINSYMVKLIYSDGLKLLQECNKLSVFSDGLYSVLIYSGLLNVRLGNDTLQNEYPVCFATDLCKGTNSPLYIDVPDNAHQLFNSFHFIRDLKVKGWDINIRSVVVSNTPFKTMSDKVLQSKYWNGMQYVSPAQKLTSLVTDVKFTKEFTMNGNINIKSTLTFSGFTHWFHNRFDQVFDAETKSSWESYLMGSIRLSLEIPVYNETSSLTLENDTVPSLFFSKDGQIGFALQLVHHINSESTGLFSTLLVVPPKEEFRSRTQLSCPLDSFMLLDDGHNMKALSTVSTCLSLNLGSFPIVGLETYVYIFDACEASISAFCPVLQPTDSNFLVWGEFPKSVSNMKLGHFLTMLPVSADSNRTGLVAKFSKVGRHLRATLLNIRVSLFDITFHTMASIDEQQLTFSENVKLFNKHNVALRGNVKQVNDWNNAAIKIHGRFLNYSGNVPQLLCKEIDTYIRLLYERAQSRVKNSKAVYDRASSQYSVSESTYSERQAALQEANDLVQQTEQELARSRNTVKELTNELQIANDEVKSLTDRIDDLCTIQQCPEICIPKRVCIACQRDVSTVVQGTCTVPCTKTQTTTVVTGYEIASRWQFVPRRFCPMTCLCHIFRCFTATRCRTIYVCTRVTYRKPIIETRVVQVPSTCEEPCPMTVVNTPIVAQCCTNIPCQQTRQDSACVGRNQQCERTRNVLYSNLADEQNSAIRLLQSLDEAKTNESVTKLRLMRFKARQNLVEKQANESMVALNEARSTLDIATNLYKAVKDENQLDLLEKFMNITICGFSTSSYIELKSVTFNTTIITESPTTLAIDIEMAITSANKSVSERMYVDFQRFSTSIKQAAVSTVNKVIFNQKGFSKRRVRNAVSNSSENDNYLHFQGRCAEVKNILTYFKELNTSIFTVAAIAESSLLNLSSNFNELSALIKSTVAAVQENTTFDLQKVADITNKNLASLNYSANVRESSEVNELMNLINEHISNGQDISNVLDKDLFKSWQAKIEHLHNQTKSAAGFSCLGFSDCLQEVTETLDELIIDSPLNATIQSVLPTAAKDLLELALLQNYSIISALTNIQKIYQIANNSILSNYWCSGPPVISLQPLKRVNPRENTTVQLSCEVEKEEGISYQWKKDYIQIPNQKNSTLVLTNIKLSDSGNYTCVVTNQVSSVTSTNASVEVQQFPSFFLQPENVDEYIGNWNGAVFQSNATGFPYPGFRWYFRPKGTSEFTQILGEDQNELVVVPPLPENEGSYYCEAFNEQGVLRSKIVNLTVLQSAVVQVAQTVYINFTYLNKLEETNTIGSGSGLNITDEVFIGLPGSGDTLSGSGFDVNMTITPATKMMLIRSLVDVLNILMSFGSTTIQNITLRVASPLNITASLTLYSTHINYPEISLSEINQLAPQARVEWVTVWRRLQEVLSVSGFIIGDDKYEFESDASSLRVYMLQFVCPIGKEVSTINNFLCVSCPPGSYQVSTAEKVVDDDGRVARFTVPKCIECPIGYYQDEQGKSTCKPCTVGHTTLTTSVRLLEDCVRQCAPGLFSQDGLEPCTKCPNGTHSFNYGSTSCFNCSDESIQRPCPTNEKPVNPCEKCQHFCRNNSTCACYENYTLSSNGYACVKCAKLLVNYNNIKGLNVLKPTWHVAICNKNDKTNSFVHSGNLINDQWIVTSAKDICNANNSTLSLKVKKLHSCAVEEDDEFELAISEIYCHPDYNKSDNNVVDLALIKAKSPVPSDKMNTTLPLCLRDESNDQYYTFSGPGNFLTYGLGRKPNSSTILSVSRVALALEFFCFEEFLNDGIGYNGNSNVFCTNVEKESTCVGNPGSAIISATKSGGITFAGVISRFTKVCGIDGSYGANTKLQHPEILKWIDSIIMTGN